MALRYRGDGALRPGGLALPPDRMPLRRGGRPLKRWTYVGVYGPEVMACFGCVSIAGLPQAFWAVWDRERRVLRERTRFLAGGVRIGDGVVRVRDRGLSADLRVGDARPVEVVSSHRDSYIWTRKCAPVRVRGTLAVDGRAPVEVDALGIVDESAGYHARETMWTWSAGAGAAADGTPVAWNLVDGVHDAPVDSERTIWVAGEPREVGPVRFEPDLSAVRFAEGGELRCTAEAVRERDDRLPFGLLHSRYRQPFGTFAGEAPGIGPLTGFGVMEHHDVRW